MQISRLPASSALFTILLCLTGCFETVPDYTPFATGLQALGVCLVCCAAVKALADLIKGHPPAPPPPIQPPVNPPNPTTNHPTP